MKKLLLLVFICCINSAIGQQTIGLFQNDSLAFNGYTLWTPNTSTYLIDNCGELINEWESSFSPGLSTYLLENGNLLRTGTVPGAFNGPGRGGIIEEYNWDGELLWSCDVASSIFHQHHDIEPMPNGNILVIAWEEKSSSQAVFAGANKSTPYWPEYIFELEKLDSNQVNIVWEWHAWDHLIQEHDSTKENFGVIADHPELLDINFRPPSGTVADWQHFNGINYDSLRDEIILSSRNMSEIYIIDHSTTTEEAASHSGGRHGKGGDYIYRWGNPDVYDKGETATKKLFGQHNALVIPESYPDAGKISIFNNGSGRPGDNHSSVDIIHPPRDENGFYILNPKGYYGPEELFWTYAADNPADFYSNNMAGAHRLPNGNTMICESNRGRFFEITQDKKIVWHYQNTAGNGGPFTQGQMGGFGFAASIFRATKYDPAYSAFEGKDLTPKGPIELEPIDYDCTIFDGQFTSINKIHKLEDLELTSNLIEDNIRLINHKSQNLDISLLNQSGTELLSYSSRNFYINLETNNYPAGLYYLFVTNRDKNAFWVEKLVIHY